MSRYKTITFDDFSDGEQCDVVAPTKESYKLSNDLIIQKNKIKLGPKVQGGVLDNMAFNYTNKSKVAVFQSTLLSVLGVHSVSGECMIKQISLSGTVTTKHAFSGGGNEALQFIKFKSLFIVSILDGSYKIQYSSNLTAWINCGTIGTGIVIYDHKIVKDRLFVLCNDAKIYYSDDGISFVLLTTLDSSYSYNDLNYLDNYLYVRSWKSGGANNGLIRISLAGEIQDEIISLNRIYFLRIFVFNGNLYLLIDYLFLYRLEGVSLKLVFIFENKCYLIHSFGLVDSISFWDSTDDDIISMDLFEKFSRPYNIVSAVDYTWMIHKYSNNYTIAVHSLSDVIKTSIYETTKYISPGNIKTYEFKTKGSFIPVQATILHKPLTANAWIKVYVKKDGASSWGSAVIDSNATNAIHKSYNFLGGDDLRTIEFKIELGTADDSETPEDPKLEFVYLPIGLANSQ